MEQNIMVEAEDQPPSQCSFFALGVQEAPSNSKDVYKGFSTPAGDDVSVDGRLSIWSRIPDSQWTDWKWQMANRLLTGEALADLPGMNPLEKSRYQKLIRTFHYAVTPYYLSLINWSDPDDPIRKQCIPDLRETEFRVSGHSDPLEEEEDTQVPGLVHRYPDRVLAVITSICAMYCRHCTRKRKWREGKTVRSKKELSAMVEYVRRTPEVREVVISGGDPLTVNIDLLDWFMGELGRIPHVEVLRIGTRVPVVLPMRITDDLVTMLSGHRPLWLNTQFNHSREVTPEAREACDKLLRAGIPVSSQSVLLRGVNDSVDLMKDLVHSLHRIMVRPYYLFQCDPVRGVEHFRTSVWKGVEIIEGLRGHTGGLCVPTFVVDATGGGGKVPLQPFYLVSASDKEIVLRNYEGMIIKYDNPREADLKASFQSSGSGGSQASSDMMQGEQKFLVPHETPRYRRRKMKKLGREVCGGAI